MFGNLSGPTLLVILFIVLLLFGAPKLPALAKSLGQSMKILKKEVTSDGEATVQDEPAAAETVVDSAADELAKAKAEAEAAKAEAAALREAAEKRASDSSSDA